MRQMKLYMTRMVHTSEDVESSRAGIVKDDNPEELWQTEYVALTELMQHEKS